MDFEILILFKCKRCKIKKEADEYDVNFENRNYIFKTCRVCRNKYKSIPTKFNNKIIIDYC